jgi:monoterpene epsilon-lactone hydrolase
MSSPAEMSGPETLGQRLVAGALRAALRVFLKPGFRAGRPIERQRRRLEAVSRATLVPRGVAFAPARLGGVPGEWVEARGAAPGATTVLYLHGGAYCVGSPATHRALTGHLALRCGARVFVADYRLAPEHPFPAAVEDGAAAYVGLLESGCRPGRVVIAGDSAGGGLAMATALRLRDLGRPLPASLVAFSPWVDLEARSPCQEPSGETMISPEWLDDCARLYLAGRAAAEPLASPVHANLAGLPPTLVQAGSDEVLLGDSERLHARLRSAGVDATLAIYPRRWHVFQAHAGLMSDSDRALDQVAAFIEAHART